MMNKLTRSFSRVLLLVMCMATIFSICATASAAPVDNDMLTITANDGAEITPRAEETEWIVRINNGNLEMRLWSYTQAKWLTDWIIVGPA